MDDSLAYSKGQLARYCNECGGSIAYIAFKDQHFRNAGCAVRRLNFLLPSLCGPYDR